MPEITQEQYATKKMVVATITYLMDANKDNVLITELDDFDAGFNGEVYEDLVRTDDQLKELAVYELSEMIYNSVKYNELADMISVEITEIT